jgi:hypothetical protein
MLINPLITTYLKMRHFARETTLNTKFPTGSLPRLHRVLVKKAAGGFEPASLTERAQLHLEAG